MKQNKYHGAYILLHDFFSDSLVIHNFADQYGHKCDKEDNNKEIENDFDTNISPVHFSSFLIGNFDLIFDFFVLSYERIYTMVILF